MKKIIFTLCILSLLFTKNVMSQACASGSGPNACVPSGLIFDGGFEAPDVTPCAVQGVAYNHAIQFKMFTTFNYPPGQVQSVDSIEFVSIDNLPCGLCWSVNQADKRYTRDEDGCINITGTTNDPVGQYKFALGLKAWINTQPALSVPATLVDQAGIKIFIRVKTVAGACPNVDTSANGNNLTASFTCPTGIEDLENNFSAMSVVPNPMNSKGVVSFTSIKSGLYTMHVSDVTGKVISSKEIEVKQGTNSIIIGEERLSAGVYFLSLGDGIHSITNRFSVTE